MKVLFPLDGSERAFKAMEQALDVLKGIPVQATLLVVMQNFEGASEDMVKAFEDDTEDEVFPTPQSTAVVFKQAAQRMKRKGVTMNLEVARGNIVQEIIDASAQHDLMVIHSTRATSRWRRRSGRTKKILRESACNVLLMQAI